MTRQIDFAGKSGTIYRYTSLDEQRPTPPAGANFVVAEISDKGVSIVFAGETDNLARGDWRSALEEARERYERVEVLTRLNVRSAVRREELADLAEQHQPPMNPVEDQERAATPQAGQGDSAGDPN
ncbi:MAG: hypothetical protein ACK4YQ_10705 [Phenylobacterium sp.]|uniref:hypothetical protein n=1 Tax=Phenylobacterium sp. TaxID=1871053 RepID=UPI00391C369E